MRENRPSEHSEQVAVVRVLRRAGLLYCAVPNGGKRGRKEAIAFRQEGVVAGVPDLLIFTKPSGPVDYVGTALEMKRQGGVPSDVRPEQRKWLRQLRELGWATVVGFGCDDALAKLRELGYGGL